MKTININRHNLSQIIWRRIYEHAQTVDYARSEVMAMAHDLIKLQDKADIQTGSISAASVWTLMATAHYFEPKIIAEVGTYIGRSTYALSEGMTLANVLEPVIYTCDYTNDIPIDDEPNFATCQTYVCRYPRTSSSTMFDDLVSKEIQADMIFLDGRINEIEIPKIEKVMHKNTVIVLDDFEGIEKGVANYSILQKLTPYYSHILVYPPDRETLARFGLRDQCTTALVIPNTLFRITAQ